MEGEGNKSGQLIHIPPTATSNHKVASQLTTEGAGLVARGLEDIARSAYERAREIIDKLSWPKSRCFQIAPELWAEAIPFLRIAADQGYPWAQQNLGVAYSNGWGVTQNDTEAVKWFQLAAKQGYSEAQYSLSRRYATGRGVPQDVNEALKWYRLSAENGDDIDKFSLGRDLVLGYGVPQDYKEAVKWFLLAAEQGNPGGFYEVGEMFAEGRGVVQSRVAAYALYDAFISAGGSMRDEIRETMAKSMPATEIDSARKLSQEMAKPGNLIGSLESYIQKSGS